MKLLAAEKRIIWEALRDRRFTLLCRARVRRGFLRGEALKRIEEVDALMARLKEKKQP